MPWIQIISPDNATGLLAKVYKTALDRAGRIYNILRLQSLNPSVLHAGISLYTSIMHRDSPLSRIQRELLATVVSQANECHY